ncbi:MAG: SIS domain-containing protein [Candidatus Latescibacterota bacterium]
MEHIRGYLQELSAAVAGLDLDGVRRIRDLCQTAREQGRQVFTCGNGGSAATASHLANDLGKGASCGRQQRFRVTALTDCVPWLTALANDISYEAVFAEQLRNLGQPGDLLIAISGSGNSPNVLAAVAAARELGMTSVGLTGFGGGKLARLVDVPLVVGCSHMGRVEDVHLVVAHLICYYFMEQAPA